MYLIYLICLLHPSDLTYLFYPNNLHESKAEKKNSFSWNKFHCGPILYSTLMQVSWSFHGVSMQVSCWLHAGPSTSMTTPSNLHGICMEPPWNLHQAECMVKPTSVDGGITSITHMETAWNLHQFSMEPAWNLHENCISWKAPCNHHV